MLEYLERQVHKSETIQILCMLTLTEVDGAVLLLSAGGESHVWNATCLF